MKRMITTLFLFFLSSQLFASAVIKVMNKPQTYLTPHQIEIKTEINNQIAVTTVRQYFKNTTGDSIMMKYGFPLPANASVIGVDYFINGNYYQAEIVGQPMDTTASGPGGQQDYDFINFCGKSPFFFSFKDTLFPDSSLMVEQKTIELLQYFSGQSVYSYPLNLKNFVSSNLDSISLDLIIRSQRRLLEINATDFFPNQQTVENFEATIVYTKSNFPADQDLTVQYKVSQEELGVFLLSMKPPNEDGYFLLLAEPNPETSQEEIIDKYFTFIIDNSGSMSGVKMEQAKEAAVFCINHLNSDDFFNIVKFSSSIQTFNPQPIQASAFNVNDGLDYVSQIQAGGGTNIHQALLTGLQQNMPDSTANIFIFLTDGRATAGITDPEQILSDIKNVNLKDVRIFSFGIGTGVNRYLLTSISEQNNGLAEYLMNDQVETRISSFYNKIRNPLMQNVQVDFSDIDVTEVYPLNIPDIYVGEQLVILGRYKSPGSAQVVLKGQGVSDSLKYTYDIQFSSDSTENLFIPKMWARKKIDALLALIDIVGENSNQGQEYKNEIISLSIQYGIMTKYTSFQAPTHPIDPPPTSVEEELMVEKSVPSNFILLPNYPNPFNLKSSFSTTKIPFVINGGQKTYHVKIRIYDLTGRLIVVLEDKMYRTGRYQISWNGRDQFGSKVSAGVYVYVLSVDGFKMSKKMLVVR